MIGEITTAAGTWSPLAWLGVIAIAAVIAYVLRSSGSGKARKGADRQMPFFSGNRIGETHVKAANIYWGFFETLESYYRWLRRMHTGIVNDYVYWFAVVVVILAAAVMWGGLA